LFGSINLCYYFDVINKLLVVLSLCACGLLRAATYDVRAFGAVGDGITDDGDAVRQAIAAAVTNPEPSVVTFPRAIYRLGTKGAGHAHMALAKKANVVIDGNGATFVVHPCASFVTLNQCTNVTVRRMNVEYAPRSFTQGTITSVDATSGILELDIHAGYPSPVGSVTNTVAMAGWQWGVVLDPIERHRKWGIGDHFFLKSAERVPAVSNRFRITATEPYRKGLQAVNPGDRFALPLKLTEDGKGTQATNFSVSDSTGCLIEDVTFYGGGNGMVVAICRNEGRITLRRVRILHKPGSDALWSAWRDGMHCKDNRVGPIIEDCTFEGMQDDSINLGANTAMATEQESPSTFILLGAKFSPGDRVLAFDLNTGNTLADTTAIAVGKAKNGQRVTLAKPIDAPIVLGSKRPHLDVRGTHFYNASYASDGYEVRGCVFKPQRRHAMLIRSSNGIIEDNWVENVGGSAVYMSNEIGSFYEGPFPQNNVIRNNTFINTQGRPIELYSAVFNPKALFVQNNVVSNNLIRVRPSQGAIRVRSCKNITIMDNRIYPLDNDTPVTNAVTSISSQNTTLK
jgi:hypothetical protein